MIECPEELIGKVLTAATEVHKALGPGLLESVYEHTLGAVYYRLERYGPAVEALERNLRESQGEYAAQNLFFLANTYPSGINTAGQIVGFDNDDAGSHGFLLSDGEYTSLDVPDGDQTYAYGINNVGQIVGSYYDGSSIHGFLLSDGECAAAGHRASVRRRGAHR